MAQDFALSDLALDILTEASQREGGEITIQIRLGNFIPMANGKTFGDGTARSNEANKSAIEELVDNDLIEKDSSVTYKMTTAGFYPTGFFTEQKGDEDNRNRITSFSFFLIFFIIFFSSPHFFLFLNSFF